MFHERALLCARILILGLATTSLAAGERASFVSPRDGDFLIGPTVFEFEVPEGEPGVERIDVYVDGRLVDSALPPAWKFTWSAPTGLSGVSIAAGVYANGQLVEKLKIRSSELAFGEVVAVVSVQLYPVVVNRKGAYVSGLSAKDFVVFDRGRRVDLELFSDKPATLSLALLIDVSQSMQNELGMVKEASIQFIDQLRPTDQVSIYSFNQAVHKGVHLSSDRERLKQDVNAFVAAGGTALYDSVVQVLNDMQGVSGRKVVIIFSDGRDDRSLSSLSRTTEKALQSEIIIYTVGAGKSRADLEAREDLRSLAEGTGGTSHTIEKLRALPAVFGSILDDVRAQYLLGFTPEHGDAGHRKLSVQTINPKLRVRCRKSYYYPG